MPEVLINLQFWAYQVDDNHFLESKTHSNHSRRSAFVWGEIKKRRIATSMVWAVKTMADQTDIPTLFKHSLWSSQKKSRLHMQMRRRSCAHFSPRWFSNSAVKCLWFLFAHVQPMQIFAFPQVSQADDVAKREPTPRNRCHASARMSLCGSAESVSHWSHCLLFVSAWYLIYFYY